MSEMPVFTLKAKDALAVEAVRAYRDLCLRFNLVGQAAEVNKAITEMIAWREANNDQLRLPHHPHVPATAATMSYEAASLRAAFWAHRANTVDVGAMGCGDVQIQCSCNAWTSSMGPKTVANAEWLDHVHGAAGLKRREPS